MAIGEKKLTKRDVGALKTRNKIFNTSIMLFTKHGFDKVTVDDITQFAGISKGSFYTHFPSKESVLVEQFHQIDDSYISVFKSVDSSMPASDQLRLFFDTMCNYCADVCGVNVMKVVYGNQISIGEKDKILIDSENREIYSQVRKIVAHGRESGEFIPEMPDEILVELIVSAARALIFNWCLYDGEKDLKQMKVILLEVLIAWLTIKHK